MKGRKTFWSWQVYLLLALFTVLCARQARATIYVPVAKRIVSDSTITEEEMEQWYEFCNWNLWPHIVLVQVTPPEHVERLYDSWIPGAVNIYGVRQSRSRNGTVSDISLANWGTMEIQITDPHVFRKTQPDTMKHEFIHILLGRAGIPRNQHHDLINSWNIMFPSWTRDPAGNQIPYQGGRTNHLLTDQQLAHSLIGAGSIEMEVRSIYNGQGHDEADPEEDVPFPYIDIVQDSFWNTSATGDRVFHGTIATRDVSFTESSQLGFYIESDHNLLTGDPVEGLDYYVGYDPMTGQSIFRRYDSEWVNLDPSGISADLVHWCSDLLMDPEPAGATMSFGWDMLGRRANDYISFRAAAEGGGFIDYSPEGYLKNVNVPEPGTMSLLVLLGAVLAILRKRGQLS